jgi:mRNA-degrading endonuclease RelE of RelBE toxin-antitoxin system
MMRVLFGNRFLRSLRKIKPDLTADAEKRLAQVAEEFGKPHVHGGIGLRKIGEKSYECRLDLHYRIVFIHRPGELEAFDIMTHEEVRQWLRSK